MYSPTTEFLIDDYVLLNTSIIVLISQQIFGDKWDQHRRPNIAGVLTGNKKLVKRNGRVNSAGEHNPILDRNELMKTN